MIPGYLRPSPRISTAWFKGKYATSVKRAYTATMIMSLI